MEDDDNDSYFFCIVSPRTKIHCFQDIIFVKDLVSKKSHYYSIKKQCICIGMNLMAEVVMDTLEDLSIKVFYRRKPTIKTRYCSENMEENKIYLGCIHVRENVIHGNKIQPGHLP